MRIVKLAVLWVCSMALVGCMYDVALQPRPGPSLQDMIRIQHERQVEACLVYNQCSPPGDGYTTSPAPPLTITCWHTRNYSMCSQ